MLKMACIFQSLCNLFFLSYSSSLAAQENETPIKKPRQYSAGRVVAEKDQTISSGSSKAIRKNKNGYAFVQNSLALGVGVYVNPVTIIDGVVGREETFLDNFLQGEQKSTIQFSIRYKAFTGKTFYWRVGGKATQFTLKSPQSWGSNDTGYNGPYTSTVNSYGVDFAIGNQWQFGSFMMGCDWIGIFQPMSSTASTKRHASETEEKYQSANKHAKSSGKYAKPEILQFYLGVAF